MDHPKPHPSDPDALDLLTLAPLTLDPLTLGGVVCARLCHDLAGTLGALSGMLDITNADGTPDSEALDLARACARELSDRLRLLRAAWGADTDVSDLHTLLPGLPNAERLAVDLAGLPTAAGLAQRRLTLSLLLVAAGALPRGGAITVSGAAAGPGATMRLAIEGARAAWPPALQPAAETQAGLVQACQEARSVAVGIAILQAQALGLSLRIVSPTVLDVG